jgi:hypothetical protein
VFEAVGVAGRGLTVTDTSAEDVAPQDGLVIVHRTVTGPVPVACVKVAVGEVAPGLNVPVPPETTDHAPVPKTGVLPPRLVVVPPVQIDWAPPTVAVVGVKDSMPV